MCVDVTILRMSSGYPDASDMLAEALKQMDGLLADTVQSVSQQNGHQISRPGSQKGPQQHVNGSQQGPTNFKSSPKLQSRIVQQINDLQTTLSGVDDRITILNRLNPETKQFFQKWMLQSDQTNGKEMLSSRVHPEPHKLDLMAENSSLKVKLARAEKELQDSDEKLTTAQSRINELQSRLNDRTIELTELRTRLARSAPSSPERSLSNSFKDKTIEREKTIERLKRKHFEVEKLKDAVESLMVSNEEKNSKIDELHNALKRYQKLEELVLKLQGPKALEQCFDDDDSNFGSAQNSNSSSNENVLNNLRTNADPVSGMPYPTATSTPVNLHSVGSLSNGHHRLQADPCSPSSAGHRAPSPVNTGARSSSFDNVITGSKTPPTVKRRADGFGTLPKDIYLRDVQQGPIRPLGYMTVPYSPLTAQNRPPVPPHAAPVQAPPTQTQTSRSNTMPRKHRAFMSFGKGFLKTKNTGHWSTSAPSLAGFKHNRGWYSDNEAKPDADEETLKDELAQEYRAIQNQPTSEVAKKKSNKGIKRLFGKLKRSNSQELDDDKTEDFKRAGLRSTAGPRLGWSKELNDLDLPFARWDTDRVALWLHVMGLSMYVGECKRWVKNGDQLLTATSHDLEKELGIRNHFHRKKLQLALQVISTDLHSPMAHLDHTWVTKWLDDIGLPQYKDQFSDARIDGRMLNYMTVDDLVNLKVTNLLHHYSFKRGIQVLRNNNFAASCLKRRPAPDEGVLHNCPDEVMLWTNHRVMEWLRSIDLSEYAPNLRGSGVHGALMVLEPRFGAEIFASILSIPNNKTLLRRHLSTHFVALIGNGVQQQKREHEADPNYLPLTPSHKVKVKKGIFRSIRADGREDFVCPMDPRQDRNLPCQNNSSPLSRTSIPREEDEKLGTRAVRQIGAFSQEITALTHLLAKDHRYLDSVPTSDV